jgi:transcriptional regulator with XRE-family HTH domain
MSNSAIIITDIKCPVKGNIMIGGLFMSTFHERLKTLRESRGVAIQDMLDLLHMTRRNYQRYENGGIDPPTSKVIALADFFGVSADYLLGRSDKP